MHPVPNTTRYSIIGNHIICEALNDMLEFRSRLTQLARGVIERALDQTLSFKLLESYHAFFLLHGTKAETSFRFSCSEKIESTFGKNK